MMPESKGINLGFGQVGKKRKVVFLGYEGG
jgi:hypothetical protein